MKDLSHMCDGLTMGESMLGAGGLDAHEAPPITAPGSPGIANKESSHTTNPEPESTQKDRKVIIHG